MIEKFKDGETVQDYRHRRKMDRKNELLGTKRDLRVRDGIGCRWPSCEFWKRGYRVDAAHVIIAAGMGGDPTLIRSTLYKFMRVCVQHHRGPVSLHSGDLKVVPQSSAGTNGPCDFYMRDPKAENGWALVGGEDTFSFRARRCETDDDGEE